MIHVFVTSTLDHCNTIFYSLPQKQLYKLQKIQNSAAHLITRTRRFDHITPILKSLHWLPINYRIMYKIIYLTFKILNNSAPYYLNSLITPYRNLCSNSNHLLTVPRIKTSFGARAFTYSAPTLWNKLPQQTKTTTSETAFKKLLKDYLSNLAFN